MDDVQKQRARRHRKNATDAEKRLWQCLRGQQLKNYKFRRQHVFGIYIVDFVCLEAKLVIELDGGQHQQQIAYDQKRTEYFVALGFTVLRFWNHEVLQETDAVLLQILQYLSPHPNPLPDGERE